MYRVTGRLKMFSTDTITTQGGVKIQNNMAAPSTSTIFLKLFGLSQINIDDIIVDSNAI